MAIQEDINHAGALDDLLGLISALTSENGCPWDRKQTPLSLTAYLIEEMYELVEAIVADDTEAICDELGDVIFQILFVAHLFQKEGRLTLNEALMRNKEKMVRRHPHVFGRDRVENEAQVKAQWHKIKQRERGDAPQSLMDSVPKGTPALMRAYRLSDRAAGVGFDWDHLKAVMAQAESEWIEFKKEIDDQTRPEQWDDGNASMEFGDVLFTLVNVARHARIHPEKALIGSIQKFIRRFRIMEDMVADQNRALEAMSHNELERLWEQAKQLEHPSKP